MWRFFAKVAYNNVAIVSICIIIPAHSCCKFLYCEMKNEYKT